MRYCDAVHFYENAATRAGHRRLRVPCDGRSVAQAALDAIGERVPDAATGGVTEHCAIVLNGTPARAGDPRLAEPLRPGDMLVVSPVGPGDPIDLVLVVLAVASAFLSSALAPRLGAPDQPSDNPERRFGFGKYSRAAARGEPIPVVLGRLVRYGGVRVSELPGEGEDGDQTLRMLIVLGEGPFNRIGNRTSDATRIKPPAISGVYLNDQPIGNFPDARVSVRMGTADQKMIPGFVDTQTLREVGAGAGGALLANTSGSEITGGSAGSEVVSYTSVDPVDALVLRVRFPRGLYTLSPQGQTEVRTARWRYRTRLTTGPGSWSAWTVIAAAKGEQSAFTQAIRIENLSGSGDPDHFDAQVERVSAEASDLTHADEMRLDSVLEVVYEQNKYANLALLAIELKASEQISSVPRVSVDVEGLKSLRIWDGISDPGTPEFTTGYSANPADQALAVLTDTRWGLGEPDEKINFPSLLDARSSVPTWRDAGGEGAEHPFECNIALMNSRDAVEWLRTICGCMRVTPVPAGQWMFVQERTRSAATETFGDGSIARDDGGGLMMSISYPATTGGRVTYNQVRGTFANAANEGETDPIVFPEAGDLWLGGEGAEQPNPKDVRLDGVTSPGQAMAELVYQMKRLRARRTVVEFTTTRQVIVCQPEERIDVACSVAGWGESGRVLAGSSAAALYLDRTITIAEAGEHAVRVIHTDGSIEVGLIDLPPGVYAPGAAIRLVGDGLMEAPDEGAEYAVGVSGIEVKPFLVESVRAVRSGDEGSDYRWRITAGEYNAAVFDRTEADVPVITYTNLGGVRMAPGPVVSLVARQRIVSGRMVVELNWQQTPADAAHTAGFVIYRRLAGTSAWIAVPGLAAGRTHVDVTIVDTDRAYDFIVVARSPLGAQLSPYDPRHPIASAAFGLGQEPPAEPENLDIEQISGNVYRLSWSAVEGAAGYQVLTGGDAGTGYPNDGAEDCLVLGRTVETQYVVTLAEGVPHTFWVRSVSAAGRLSFAAAVVTIADPDGPAGMTEKHAYAADLGADGTFTNATWDGGDGVATIDDASDIAGGVWESGVIDTGENTLSRLCVRLATGNQAEDFAIEDILFGVPSIEADQWGVVSGAGPTALVGMLNPPYPDDAQAWVVEVKTSEDGVVFTDYAALPACTELDRTFQYYRVRISMRRKGGGTERPYAPGLRGVDVVVCDA